jgi:2-phosphoglycerate kinase
VNAGPRRIMPLPLGGGELGLPYSRGLMARSLMAAGVAAHRAYALATRVGDELAERGTEEIELERLEELAVDVLGEEEGGESIQRLRRYHDLRELDLPLIVFIGGATGTGKSTVATELAYRFGITRVTSTDFIRQTMRAFFSNDFMPSIHQSSFEAGDAFADADDPLEFGFLSQSRNVLVGARASSERALEEGWSLVLEGIHLVPGMVELPSPDRAVSVFIVLSIEDEDEHARHFAYRDENSERPESRYLERFDDIRILQEIIVERALAEGVQVIENDDADRAARTVADLVLDAADRSREAQ